MPIERSLRPKIIDRYIFSEIVLPLLGGMAFFCFVFLMFQILRLAEFFIVHGVPFFSLLKLTTLLSLSFLPFALPISFLIGLLLAFGRLSTDSELIALKAGGYSLKRLLRAPVLIGLLVSALSLLLNLQWVPQAEKELKLQLAEIGNTRIVSAIRAGTFTSGFFDLLVYADKVSKRGNSMEGVFIFDEREPKNPLTVVANRGVWTTQRTAQGGSQATLKLSQGNIHRSDPVEGSYQKIDFDEYRIFLKIDGGAGAPASKPKMLTASEIRKAIAATRTSDPRFHRILQAEWWRRLAVAFAPLCFLLLGIGSGTLPTRSVRSGAALIAFGVLLIYYGLLTWGGSLAESGTLPAWLALQGGNLVTAIWGALSFRSASRH